MVVLAADGIQQLHAVARLSFSGSRTLVESSSNSGVESTNFSWAFRWLKCPTKVGTLYTCFYSTMRLCQIAVYRPTLVGLSSAEKPD
jgi:hypothetical protein